MIRKPYVARWVAVGAVALATVALGGCSAPGGSGGGEKTRVTVWHGFTEADGKVVDAIADEFNASQDDYDVKLEVNPWNVITDKLLPAVSSGNGPDLVVQTPEAGQGYVNQGVFVSLQDFYDDPDFEADSYYPNVVDAVTFDGDVHGVPMGYAPFAVWYNKAMFDAAGVTEFPKTWEAWIALAEQLTIDENGDGTPEVYGLSLADKTPTFLPTWLEGAGGHVYADGEIVLDTEQNVETLQWWRDAYAGNWGPRDITLAESVDVFKAGKAAMTLIGPWMIGIADSVGMEVGVFELPAGPDKVAADAAANYWWLTSQAEDAEAQGAMEFLAYFNSHESQVKWALEANYPPNRTDITAEELADNPFVADMLPFTENTFVRLGGLPGGATDVNAELDSLSVHITQGTGGDVATLVAETDRSLTEILAEFE